MEHFSSGNIGTSGSLDDVEAHPGLKFLPKVLENQELRDPRIYGSIKGLLDRPNWFRAWIVQEIALAKHGHILCGEQNVSQSGHLPRRSYGCIFCQDQQFRSAPATMDELWFPSRKQCLPYSGSSLAFATPPRTTFQPSGNSVIGNEGRNQRKAFLCSFRPTRYYLCLSRCCG